MKKKIIWIVLGLGLATLWLMTGYTPPERGMISVSVESMVNPSKAEEVKLPVLIDEPQPNIRATEIPKYMGPLTESEREAIYKSSLSSLADTHPEAVVVAKRLGISHPSNMCGPLAASFLIDARIVTKSHIINKKGWGEVVDVLPVHFWELEPVKDEWKLNTWFPKDKFDRFYFNEPVGKFDFVKFPLYTGDFLYLFYSGASGRGTFTHIMVVSRVDSAGKAYSVTNLRVGPWTDGKGEFVIREVMLYDPNNPGYGQFADYNNPKFADFGLTGYSFLVIRRK